MMEIFAGEAMVEAAKVAGEVVFLSGKRGLPGEDGEPGDPGERGFRGYPGEDGEDGESAYAVYLATTTDSPVLSAVEWAASRVVVWGEAGAGVSEALVADGGYLNGFQMLYSGVSVAYPVTKAAALLTLSGDNQELALLSGTVVGQSGTLTVICGGFIGFSLDVGYKITNGDEVVSDGFESLVLSWFHAPTGKVVVWISGVVV